MSAIFRHPGLKQRVDSRVHNLFLDRFHLAENVPAGGQFQAAKLTFLKCVGKRPLSRAPRLVRVSCRRQTTKGEGMVNQLYYGDNLAVLREHVRDESVDLIYLDPPFNSNASYNVLFKSPTGEQSQAQIEAFDDSWHWNDAAARAFDEVWQGRHREAGIMLRAMRDALGENDMMAYLAMMAVRLIELHRVLKPTGSLYLHCDPTASHYLKIILDAVFDPRNFCSEIIWKRTSSHGNVTRGFGDVTDTILYFNKSNKFTWHDQYIPYSEKALKKFSLIDSDGRRYLTENLRNPGFRPNLQYEYKGYKPHPNGWAVSKEKMDQYDREGRLAFPDNPSGRIRLKRYLDEQPGQKLQNLWEDISPINSQAQERLGYPTQKPVALLERIIAASSNEADVVLDPFCGCGTTVHAAQKLNRQWTRHRRLHADLAIALIERRLKDAFPGIEYQVHGVPKDVGGAEALALADKHEFQKWIVGAIEGQPYKGGKKGMDRGIDGYLHFRDADKKPQVAIISVKGGGTSSAHIRDLKGVLDRENAKLGIFLTLNPPTREMQREAAAAGLYETGGRKFARIQILTAAQIIDQRKPDLPFGFAESLKRAAAEQRDDGQGRLL